MKDEMGGAGRAHGETRNAYKILVRTSEGNRLLGRFERKWEDNIKMDLTETVIEVWVELI
jgi:hypothetical protein